MLPWVRCSSNECLGKRVSPALTATAAHLSLQLPAFPLGARLRQDALRAARRCTLLCRKVIVRRLLFAICERVSHSRVSWLMFRWFRHHLRQVTAGKPQRLAHSWGH